MTDVDVYEFEFFIFHFSQINIHIKQNEISSELEHKALSKDLSFFFVTLYILLCKSCILPDKGVNKNMQLKRFKLLQGRPQFHPLATLGNGGISSESLAGSLSLTSFNNQRPH